MRTLLLFLAASTLSVATASATAPAANPAAPVTLVETSRQTRPGGGLRIHYTLLERIQPLVAVRSAANGAPATTIVSGDAARLSYEQDPEGWITVAALTVDEYGPHGPAAASVASSAASTTGDPAPAVPLTLAIAPVRPDPVSSRALVVDVALPSADAARLELMDVMGRRVASRDLGSLGIGRHSVDLGDGQRFAPGVYLLRLTQGREASVARVTIVD